MFDDDVDSDGTTSTDSDGQTSNEAASSPSNDDSSSSGTNSGSDDVEDSLQAARTDADTNLSPSPLTDAGSNCGTPGNSSPSPPPSSQKTWVEYLLVDDQGNAVPNVRYRVKASDGTMTDGAFDAKGKARIETINPGNCKIWILDIDGQEWKAG